MTHPCPECGRSWEDPATFCGVCGAMLEGLPSPTTTGRRAPAAVGPARSRWVAAASVAGLFGVVAVVWWLGGAAPDGAPSVRAEQAVDGGIELPSGRATTAEVEDGGVPMELLATCQGPGGPSGCVRWVNRAGQLPRSGSGTLVTVVGDRVVALDPDTGSRRWTVGTTPPVAPPLGIGSHTVLVEDASGVRALDGLDGDERWRHPGQHLPSTAPEQVDQDVVVLDDLDGTLTGVAVEDGAVRWTSEGVAVAGIPVVVIPISPDRSAVATFDRTWVLDMATGRRVWGNRDRGTLEAPVAVTGQHVVTRRFEGDDGASTLRVRRPDGRLLAQVPLAADVGAREIAVTEALLVLRTGEHLLAWRLADGSPAWRRDDLTGRLATARGARFLVAGVVGGRPGPGEVATRSRALVVMNNDGTATVLDARTGRDVRTLGEPANGLRIGDGFVTNRRLWRTDAASLEVYDLPSGSRVLRIEVRAPPTVVTTDPVVVATSGRLVRLDLAHPTPAGTDPER